MPLAMPPEPLEPLTTLLHAVLFTAMGMIVYARCTPGCTPNIHGPELTDSVHFPPFTEYSKTIVSKDDLEWIAFFIRRPFLIRYNNTMMISNETRFSENNICKRNDLRTIFRTDPGREPESAPCVFYFKVLALCA